MNPLNPVQRRLLKAATLFFVALAFYTVFYQLDRHWRLNKGPWTVEFAADPAQTNLVLTINQASLGIENFQILIEGETTSATNLPKAISFDDPYKTLPFGDLFYHDLTYLPGVLTLDIMGHEIELLPRILTVNRESVPWKGKGKLHLTPDMKVDEDASMKQPRSKIY